MTAEKLWATKLFQKLIYAYDTGVMCTIVNGGLGVVRVIEPWKNVPNI